MLMICSKVISNSPEGLQHLLDIIYKHAQEWKLKANTNKNRRKAIFNWAAKGAIFSEGRGRLYTLTLP